MSTFKKYPARWFISLFIAMIVVAWRLPRYSLFGLNWYLIAWLTNLALMIVIVGVISKNKEQDPEWKRGEGGTAGSPGWFDVLIDNRNKYSLSRFQIMAWTLVVMSAIWTIAIARGTDSIAHAKDYACKPVASQSDSSANENPIENENNKKATCAAPADIQLPEILWALMGISVTTAVASPLIKNNTQERTQQNTSYFKLKLKPAEDGLPVMDSNGEQVKDSQGNGITSNFDAAGAISIRKKGPPLLSDMFMSEDPGNEYVLNIGKVQNFFFTVVAVIIYAFVLGAAIAGTKSIAALYQFPDLSEGLVAIIGISHAGYLVNKATDTDTGPAK